LPAIGRALGGRRPRLVGYYTAGRAAKAQQEAAMTATGTEVQAKVRELVAQQIAEGRNLGVQVCAYHEGRPIVDLAAGQMGPDDPRPVQPDTLFNSFSTTKGVAALALHILADRGQIAYDAPVARYWPEFGANGKQDVTVEIAMSHQAGLHAMPRPATVEFLIDWQAGVDWVANGTPAWTPGTATGYHGITYAWIVGGIVGGAGGRRIQEVIHNDIATALGIADEMYVGIPDGVEDRLATQEAQQLVAALPIPPDHDLLKAIPPELPLASVFNEMRVRKACIPSANGHFSARALAKMYAALANGGEVDGVRLVSPERIPLMQRVLVESQDRVLGQAPPKGVGFWMGGNWGLNGATSVFGPRRTALGHSGAGGSTAFADPEARLSVAVTINKMQTTLQGEGPTEQICNLIRRELGVA
jgi:CubicO group peptidase (beta-lactamase class C family)